MGVIINELSFEGQFTDEEDFYSKVRQFVNIVKTLTSLRVTILKNFSFYDSPVTSTSTLMDILKSRPKVKSDESTALRIALLNLTEDPFWEYAPAHNCTNEYVCSFTAKLCEYGLAEAAENLNKTISIEHDNFLISRLPIRKDAQALEIENIWNIDTLRDAILDLMSQGIIQIQENHDSPYLPMTSVIKNLKYNTLLSAVAGIDHNRQIAIYNSWGNYVALLNFWELDPILSRRSMNDRDIYKKRIGNSMHYLSIDTENGGLEIFNSSGKHLGEFNYLGKLNSSAKSHTIRL